MKTSDDDEKQYKLKDYGPSFSITKDMVESDEMKNVQEGIDALRVAAEEMRARHYMYMYRPIDPDAVVIEVPQGVDMIEFMAKTMRGEP